MVPTPMAARGITPRDDMKAVSTRPVIGSAVSDKSTGMERPIKVRWGYFIKGWVVDFIIFSQLNCYVHGVNKITNILPLI